MPCGEAVSLNQVELILERKSTNAHGDELERSLARAEFGALERAHCRARYTINIRGYGLHA
jgi:hypothetical protein